MITCRVIQYAKIYLKNHRTDKDNEKIILKGLFLNPKNDFIIKEQITKLI